MKTITIRIFAVIRRCQQLHITKFSRIGSQAASVPEDGARVVICRDTSALPNRIAAAHIRSLKVVGRRKHKNVI